MDPTCLPQLFFTSNSKSVIMKTCSKTCDIPTGLAGQPGEREGEGETRRNETDSGQKGTYSILHSNAAIRGFAKHSAAGKRNTWIRKCSQKDLESA